MLTPSAAPGAAVEDRLLVQAILSLVRERMGTDFSQYRPAMIHRRIHNRMMSVGAASIADYLEFLRACDAEVPHLLARLTIKVSSFYRSATACDLFRSQLLPSLAHARHEAPLRIWSVGCGRGEEPYTLAMLLEEQALSGVVYATDIDGAALAAAATAAYAAEAVVGLPDELATAYLEALPGGRHTVTERVRRRVRFSQHDVTSDAPFAGGGVFDVVSCRNVLIYLQPKEQRNVLTRLCRALADDGLLWLGEAEWPSRTLEPLLRRASGGAQIFHVVR